MKTEYPDFISITTWMAILVIAFGLIGGRIESTFIPWFFFAFFCFIGLVRWSVNRSRNNKNPP